ncbi:MAG: hypothetical protein R3E31_21010 [Chloroflexota bacterium]
MYAGCGGRNDTAVTIEATVAVETAVKTPVEVIVARNAVLDFCARVPMNVPPEGAVAVG